MPDLQRVRKRALDAIDQRRDALVALSLAIHAKPELGYQEREASLRLTEFLEGDGFGSRSSPNTTRSPTSGTAAGTTSSR